MNDLVLPLDSSDATLEVAGGKGANLSRLARAGFPVPPGFLVTTAAYRAFVEANRLEEQIMELSRAAPTDDPASLEDVSNVIRGLFNRGSIPEPVAAAIRRAYRELSHMHSDPKFEIRNSDFETDHPVAVRSSATAEDLPDASFAGQQETYLNVRGEEALLEAVKRCWASLWTARAMSYRARQDIDPATVSLRRSKFVLRGSPDPRRWPGSDDPGRAKLDLLSLAVVVQQMVPADAAGILFTVNPVTANHDEAVINAAWGLGEAVVGGSVTPDTIIIDKAAGRVKQVEVADKVEMTVPTDAGTAKVPVDPDRRRQPALTPEQAAELVRLGCEIEAHFGAPQDVEWAIAGGRLYVLQARPVTGLPEVQPASAGEELTVPGDDDWPALDERPPQPFDLWTRVNVGEVWPHPVSPLLWSGVTLTLNQSARYFLRGLRAPYLDDIQWARRFYGCVYYNEGAIAHILTHEFGLPGSFVDAAFGSRRSPDFRRWGGFHPLRFLRRLPAFLRLVMGRLGTDRELEALFPQIDRWVADFLERHLEESSDGELWAELRWVWVERSARVINLHTEVSGSALAAFSLLERLIARWCGRGDLAQDLVTGLSDVYAAEMGTALWQVAQKLRDLGLANVVLDNSPEAALAQLRETPDAQPVIQMLDAFLQRHGHRCPNEGEWLFPRWAEAPEQVIEMVAGYLRAGDRVNPTETEERQRQRREEAVTWVGARLDPVRRAIFRRVLARAQHAVRLRDNGKHYLMKTAFPFVRIYRALGQRWADRGWLRQPEDIFFLTIPDVEQVIKVGNPASAGLDLLTLAAERRQAYEYWFDVEAPEVIGPDGRPIDPAQDKPVAAWPASEPAGAVLQGIAASGGQVRGAARIIHDPREATRLQPGDILVTRATDPGWTPVFPLVGGLVLEVGGQLSHGAIVAREYGVPAVVNVHDAAQRIQDGQIIVVDGTAGHVHLYTP